MLGPKKNEPHGVEGKPFACPVCRISLPILLSVKQKPYCVCNECGIQLFFRGQAGIARLHALLQNSKPITTKFSRSIDVVAAYNRLEQLRAEKSSLEEKQGIFFRDEALTDTLSVISAEIKTLELELKKSRKTAEQPR
jgi:hypothetical protein